MKLALVLASALTFYPTFSSPVESVATGDTKSADAADLGGTYACEGTKPDGASYHGVVRIARNNGAYQVLWTVGDEEQYLGIGIATGNVLSVSYFGGTPGVVVYQIEQSDKGPRLVGQWTVLNADGQVFTETLTRLTQDISQPDTIPGPQPGRVVLSRGMRPA